MCIRRYIDIILVFLVKSNCYICMRFYCIVGSEKGFSIADIYCNYNLCCRIQIGRDYDPM